MYSGGGGFQFSSKLDELVFRTVKSWGAAVGAKEKNKIWFYILFKNWIREREIRWIDEMIVVGENLWICSDLKILKQFITVLKWLDNK